MRPSAPVPNSPPVTPNSPGTGPPWSKEPTRRSSPGGSPRSKPTAAEPWPCSTNPSPRSSQRMTRDQISDLVGKLGDIISVRRDADPADRAEVYQQLGLRLTYHPTQHKVRVQAQPGADPYR